MTNYQHTIKYPRASPASQVSYAHPNLHLLTSSSLPFMPQNLLAMFSSMIRKLFSRENLAALLLCLVVILVLILTADQSPQWIYQGF